MKNKSKNEILRMIREKLKFKDNITNQLRYVDENELSKEHRRFDMSGYETNTGECTIFNLDILNSFADLGIYDYTSYLFLDFYKGSITLYLKYFYEEENLTYELDGYGTVDIIYFILQKTIFSEKRKRRRI